MPPAKAQAVILPSDSLDDTIPETIRLAAVVAYAATDVSESGSGV